MNKLGLDAVEIYVKEVIEKFNSGHAKEHAYRPALERLMGSFEDVLAVNDPKRSEHGNPDMVFLKDSNRAVILGYAEAKDVDVSLDKTEKTNQMHRYSGYDNLYLTNYLEFRFYLNGEKQQTISVGELKGGGIELLPQNYSMLADELQNFLDSKPETIRSGKRLALIMGAKARRIRDRINRKFTDEDMRADELNKIYKIMKELLVHDLTQEKFADMYAQTLVYGLFVARYGDKTQETFSRSEAVSLVPVSNPFLRDFFEHIAGNRFDKDLAQIVDELCEVFQASDVQKLIEKHLRLFEVEDEKDPIIHFYEDFLKEYDAAERKRMGAYYTPVPIVRFIIRKVDEILKNEFGLTQGLADTSKITKEVDLGQEVSVIKAGNIKVSKTSVINREFHRVQVLDPAVGTATFLNETIKFIHKHFKETGQTGQWPAYVRDNLIPRIHGFELMMAPYTIAHLKLGMTLADTGVTDLGERLGVYLTNTLEEGVKHQQDLFGIGFAETISHEAQEAANIKHDRPIMVVVGNPPYSVSSNNKSAFIENLTRDYKKNLNEKNIQPLSDDYIKFIRFAEEMISKNGSGIVAMITNNSYIDGLIHRQMRKHLLETFDKIYVLDLHGSSKKLETTPDGSKDENVFEIQQGVSIILAIKKSAEDSLAEVYHADLFGKRAVKFYSLNTDNVEFNKIETDNVNYFFIEKDAKTQNEYDKFISIRKLMPIGDAGVKTHRDNFVIDFDKTELESRIKDFYELPAEFLIQNYNIKDGRDFSISTSKASSTFDTNCIRPIAYRPFDTRWSYYSKWLMDWPREKTMKHMLKDNYGLIVLRGCNNLHEFTALVTDKITEKASIPSSNYYILPLHLHHHDGTVTVNFDEKIKKLLTVNLTNSYEPEAILDYVYAVLNSPRYRETYKEFLKIDFPKVPVPASDIEFRELGEFGKQLRDLHLMHSPVLDDFDTTYPEVGNNEVEKISFDNNKVWINGTQYFGSVPESAWGFYIGGYQPAQKWLKDRKGRKLSSEDIDHYQRIVKVLLETDRLMKEIDKV